MGAKEPKLGLELGWGHMLDHPGEVSLGPISLLISMHTKLKVRRS